MGLCAQTPGHIVVQEKGFSCTHIVYHNGRYFAHRKKYNFFIDLIDAKPFISPHKCL